MNELGVRTNREISSHQISDCVQVIGVLRNCLGMAGFEENGNLLSKDTRFAVETSLIRALTRLDVILANDARWLLPETDAQSLYLALVEAQRQSVVLRGQALEQQARMTVQALIDQLANDPPAPETPSKRRKGKTDK